MVMCLMLRDNSLLTGTFFFKKILSIYFYREGREGEREGDVHQLTPTQPPLGTWTPTQACALMGDLSLCRPALNPLSHASQG